MKIAIRYMAQARAAAGTDRTELNVEDGAHVHDVVRQLAAAGTEELRALMLTGDAISPTLFVACRGRQVRRDQTVALADGDELMIGTPLAGG